MSDHPFPMRRSQLWLGLSGILPQAIAVGLVIADGEWRWIALAAGWAYAALIFSFLGGLWWGMTLREPKAPSWVPWVAVIPSLIALATYLPWTLGLEWPAPALAMIGTLIILSPVVDWLIGKHVSLPAGWLKLRILLSTGLGGLTIMLATLAKLY